VEKTSADTAWPTAFAPYVRALAGFRWVPGDPSQALRIRRFSIAAVTALMVAVLLLAASTVSLLPRAAAQWASGAIVALVAVFYLLFRSGLNRRFRDPSLTFELCAVSILALALILAHAGPLSGALDVTYAVILTFGVFRLGTGRMLALAALALAAQGAVILAAGAGESGGPVALDWARYAVLFVFLPWFAWMAGYVNALRRRLSESNRRLAQAKQRIEEVAVRDELTGLYNRRYLMDILGRETTRARRSGAALSVCLLDVDHFKHINDSFGHGAGDAVLQNFARAVAEHLRTSDTLGRIGGEEFLVVMPDTDVAGAFSCAERIRDAVQQRAFAGLPDGHRVTVTVGVARFKGDEEMASLVERADRALYVGKTTGRNRVFVIGDLDFPRVPTEGSAAGARPPRAGAPAA
jgi:diguanylate cyclase (GGDEF)-like protein